MCCVEHASVPTGQLFSYMSATARRSKSGDSFSQVSPVFSAEVTYVTSAIGKLQLSALLPCCLKFLYAAVVNDCFSFCWHQDASDRL